MARIELKHSYGGSIMQKITLNRRNIIFILSYLFVATLVFIMGYLFGFKSIDEKLFNETSTYANSPYTSLTPTITPTSALYRVILEDGQIRLYIDENGISRMILSEEISENAYPVSDIASLKNGFRFDAMDKAIALMENFIS